jgi:ADP-heptose:LPS heptosyltransferase
VPPPPPRAWAARIPDDGRLRVGLAWSGSRDHKEDTARSIPLAKLRPLADVGAGAALCGVHKYVRETDLAELARFPGLVHLSAGFADFADTAAALPALDLLISVDTSVAHLAATLGCPTWIMLPWVPDWRWLLGREDSPWYPSVRLFRQPVRGDWDSVLGRVQAALVAQIAAHRAARAA